MGWGMICARGHRCGAGGINLGSAMTTIDVRRRLFRLLVRKVITPALVSSEDLDAAVDYLKTCVVEYGDRRALPKDAIAFHFGKSDRWVYNYLENLKNKKSRAPVVKRIKAIGPPALPDVGEGYRQMVAVVGHLQEIYPRSASVEELGTMVGMYPDNVGWDSFRALLSLYEETDQLDTVDTHLGVRYRSHWGLPGEGQSLTGEQWMELESRLELLWPLLSGVVQGEDGTEFSDLKGELTEAAYENFRMRVRRAMAEAYTDALHESMMSPDREGRRVKLRALFALGRARVSRLS